MHRIFTVFHLVSYQYPECFTHILMFLAFGTSSFEVPATQCFLDQHTQSSQWQAYSVSFINICSVHTDGHTAFPSSTRVKRTVRPGAHWDAGNAAHAGQSSAVFCDAHVSVCQHELRGRAGQHSSASASACATQCSGHSFATQPTQGRAAQVSVIHMFEYVSASWEVEQGSTVLRLLSPAPDPFKSHKEVHCT